MLAVRPVQGEQVVRRIARSVHEQARDAARVMGRTSAYREARRHRKTAPSWIKVQKGEMPKIWNEEELAMTFKKGLTIFVLCLAAFCLQLMFFWIGENALSPHEKDCKTLMFVMAGTAVMGAAALIGGLAARKSNKPRVGQKVVNNPICSYLIAALRLSF
jgi:hypothetical protein